MGENVTVPTLYGGERNGTNIRCWSHFASLQLTHSHQTYVKCFHTHYIVGSTDQIIVFSPQISQIYLSTFSLQSHFAHHVPDVPFNLWTPEAKHLILVPA